MAATKYSFRALLLLALCMTILPSCKKNAGDENEAAASVYTTPGDIDYRHEMRQFVVHLSQYARTTDSDFIVIPQNGQQLCTTNGAPDGPLAIDYMASINGQGREELFYGFDNNDDDSTPEDERAIWLPHLEVMRDAGIKILETDYCTPPSRVDDSYAQNDALGFISFAADTRDLYTIPSYPMPIHHENANVVTTLDEAQNFLYIINTQGFETKAEFIAAISETNYDAIIMDGFFEDEEYTTADIEQLSHKANGGERIVIAYMSIGEAEDYRFYWEPYWSFAPPSWMGALNPDWPGNFAVEYWNPEWQSIIYGNDDSYLHKIVSAGFDGVYLDIIDAFETWEEN